MSRCGTRAINVISPSQCRQGEMLCALSSSQTVWDTQTMHLCVHPFLHGLVTHSMLLNTSPTSQGTITQHLVCTLPGCASSSCLYRCTRQKPAFGLASPISKGDCGLTVACHCSCFHQEALESLSHYAHSDSMLMASLQHSSGVSCIIIRVQQPGTQLA